MAFLRFITTAAAGDEVTSREKAEVDTEEEVAHVAAMGEGVVVVVVEGNTEEALEEAFVVEEVAVSRSNCSPLDKMFWTYEGNGSVGFPNLFHGLCPLLFPF